MANPTLQDIQERFVYRDMIGIDGKDVTYLLNRIEKLEATIEQVREAHKSLIRVVRMPNTEWVADDHNAALQTISEALNND